MQACLPKKSSGDWAVSNSLCHNKEKDGFVKKGTLACVFVFLAAELSCAEGFGFTMEAGAGYNYDENVGLGFLAKTKGMYIGAGARAILFSDSKWILSAGIHIDFLINPEITFMRGEEHYQVENLGSATSLRLMPYAELSKSIKTWLYIGFGLGYGYNNIYFGMRPLRYDRDYTSYQLSNNSWTPTLFVRVYLFDAFYVSFNYEADIVVNGELKRLAGDPLADFQNIDGATDINGVHHRGRFVVGYLLGFD